MYLSTEFNYKTGKIKADFAIVCGERTKDCKMVSKISKKDVKNEIIIDDNLCVERNGELDGVALSMKSFAIGIIKNKPPFDRMDCSGFEAVFDLIQRIYNFSQGTTSYQFQLP